MSDHSPVRSTATGPVGQGTPIKVYSPSGGGLRDAVVYVPQGYWASRSPPALPSAAEALAAQTGGSEAKEEEERKEQEAQRQWPLIVALHGKTQTAEVFAAQTRLSDPAINSEFIVVYPTGLGYQWTGDPEAPPRSQVNDVQFVDDLLRYMLANYDVDAGRIFLTGFSNGAGLAALVACHARLSRAVRAIALASASIFLDEYLNEPTFSRFEATRFPIPLLEFHGDADPVVDYNGVDTVDGPSWPMGDWLRGYTWMMERGLNGHVLEEEADEETLHDGRVERFAWRCGTQDEIVVHYIIRGFGHGWPSTTRFDDESQRHGPTVFDATPIILDFFRKAATYSSRTSED